MKVLGWDHEDTGLHIDSVHHELTTKLRWPDDEKNIKQWRETWGSAFVLRNREVITTSRDLAARLAILAQRIRELAKQVLAVENANGGMQQLYRAFRETLISDLTEDDFADMYAQTIAYGLLAARMSRPMGITSGNIADMVPNTNPFLRDILGTFIATGGRHGEIDFDELGVQDIVETLNSPDTHMEAILRDFGNRTRQEDPVIHFYELFLSEYDKEKKVKRGVFYTPQPVVSYIVRSVHGILQKEFDLADGLADITTWGEMTIRNKSIKIPEGVSPSEPFVQILDPAVGTATFLVEVVDVIHKTMVEKWLTQGHMALELPQLWNEYVPKHLLPRLYGYELMMAPYAIAHMRLGLKLYETGYRFGEETTRVNVYLTNSLEPAGEVGPHRKFEQLAPALAHEAKAVNEIKWSKQFTLIIGNPPYSVSSQNKSKFIEELMNDYKHDLNERNIQPLSDDYIKFIRYGQYLIERNHVGILAYISNNGFLDGVIHRQMRMYLLTTFDEIYILDLHGNIKKKETADGAALDQNVFDIMQGVGISIFVVDPMVNKTKLAVVKHCDYFGNREDKYQKLLKNTVNSTEWNTLQYKEPYYFFVPKDFRFEEQYNLYFKIDDIFLIKSSGVKTHNDKELVSILPFESKYNKFYHYKPFDLRYIDYDLNKVVRNRYDKLKHVIIGDNYSLITCRNQIFSTIGFITKHLSDIRYFSNPGSIGTDYIFPLYLYSDTLTLQTVSDIFPRQPNLNPKIIIQIAEHLDMKFSPERDGIEDHFTPIDILDYIYAILYSPTYIERYKSFIKIDFPRVPCPPNRFMFFELVKLGDKLREVHLLESPKSQQFITSYHQEGNNVVNTPIYTGGKVFINGQQYFSKVPQDVWDFHIGGYQVCEKWLKDRKGRILSAEDINHYQKIVVALNETISLMKEIDEVIDKYGGWPGAFQ